MRNNGIILIMVIAVLGLNLITFSAPKNAYAHAGNAKACISLKHTLRIGSRDSSSNGEVSKLQNFLHSLGYMAIEPTGYFGNVTDKAVRSFQAKENLSVVGQVGPMTRAKINAVSCTSTIPEKAVVTPQVTAPALPEVKAEVKVETVKAKKLPYASTNFQDWTSIWGEVSTTAESTLKIKALAETTGAQVQLSDSNEWTNYSFDAAIFVKQATVTLISRYIDDNNFLGCTFSGKYVEIIQKINGQTTVVNFTTVTDFPYYQYFSENINFKMRVKDKTVGCTLIGNEDNVTFNNIDEKLLKGGVGLQIWVNANGIANVELKNVKVSAI